MTHNQKPSRPALNEASSGELYADEYDVIAADLIQAETEEVCEVERRADQKAGVLAAVLSLIGAGVLAMARWTALPAAAAAVVWVSLIPIGLALVRLLAAIRPDFAEAPWRRYTATDFRAIDIIADFKQQARLDETAVYSWAIRLQVHSRATMRKLTAIRTAVALIHVGLAGLIIASLLAVIL